MYTVYKHTTPNGKVYIGITKQKPQTRWRHGEGYIHSTYFYNAIKKYGWENIKHEIIYANLTHDEAEAYEKALIKEYKSNQKGFGYNLDSGGNVKYEHSEETKEKIRRSHIGIKHTEEAKKKISECKKGNKNRLGQKQSEDCKRKISEKNKGKSAGEKNYFHTHIFRGASHHNTVPVSRYTIDGEYIDTREAAVLYSQELGKRNSRHIIEVCKGERQTAYGYKWKYADKREV